MAIVIMLLIGAASGWFGSLIFAGSSLGLSGNLIVGILGSAFGYWLFGELGLSLGTELLSTITHGTLGAITSLVIMNILFSEKKE